MAAALAAGVLVCGCAAPAHATPHVTVEVLPQGTTLDDIAGIPGLSLGLMSAGIGDVPAEQTYLDISQGNRIASSLYDGALPAGPVSPPDPTAWNRILERAKDAPGEIIPGLLASTLLSADIPVHAGPFVPGSAGLMAVDRDGMLSRVSGSRGLTVLSSGVPSLRRSISRKRDGGLLIAFAAAPPGKTRALPIGIAGSGFHGSLTSDSTRTPGYVLSTDIAPTVLRWLGLPVPNAISGQAIRAEGNADPAAIADRAARMAAIPDRRSPVVVAALLSWIVVAAAAGLLSPRSRRAALAWLALAFAYMPLMLLAGAAIEPSAVGEGLLVGLGAAALAELTLVWVRGWWALVAACAITVTAYAIDVVTGSELTKLSLLGPNPIFGARFYGIGNELEALIAVMVPVAVGAALTASRAGRRSAVGVFLGVGVLAGLIFAAGRFGADVGAAIVLPAGAAVAAIALTWGPGRASWRPAAALIGAPLAAVTALALIDLVSGGNSHLTRSVLDAGGAGDLADLAQRRLELSAHDFAQAVGNPLFWIVVVGVAGGIARWRRIDAWLEPFPAARAGVIGACAAVAVGVLVNDSGATFLVLGSLALGAALAFTRAHTGTDP